ncbi:HD domain-containing protein [Sedimentitalea todarodis]|uniref:HD domain-containing protein n=1 Tax=Sedimentitalea todarodis TaxID=1631240 RepID=A0ABU3VC06_9RHOB|nr:HD domain-containing protein [Sedimentitalea todarodis]MDU9003710.1 HD domain-containing protein [Sedimentitalea todarodis]
MTERLDAQFAFLREADKLKSILRASCLIDGSRHENSAEHSWHIMLYALVLSEQAAPGVDINRVLKMLLIHDIVEIDAGDAPIHGNVDHAAMAAKEAAAADRLFRLLPSDQAESFRALWGEFEAAESPDAIHAKSIDRLQTPIANLVTGGGSWKDYDVTLEQLEARVGVPVKRGLPKVWAWLLPKLQTFFAARERG